MNEFAMKDDQYLIESSFTLLNFYYTQYRPCTNKHVIVSRRYAFIIPVAWPDKSRYLRENIPILAVQYLYIVF